LAKWFSLPLAYSRKISQRISHDFYPKFFAFMSVGCVLSCACLAAQEAQEGRLLRFPDIYKDKIAFVYGGDLWLASSSGGTARRITSHPGRELFPKFSPDGKWLAFTGQYDGNFNVYVMPSEGGQPKQLTFYQGSGAAAQRPHGRCSTK
jgi:tricorn protease